MNKLGRIILFFWIFTIIYLLEKIGGIGYGIGVSEIIIILMGILFVYFGGDK
jgi:hypothetical protein